MNRIVKKAAALLAVAAVLCVSGCGKGGDAQPTTTAVHTSAVTQAQTSAPAKYGTGTEYNKSWNTSLPAGFPNLPEGAELVSTKIMPYEAFKSDYSCEYMRITMRCMEHHFALLSNGLSDGGFVGGYAFYDEGSDYGERIAANWSNGEYFITVSSSEYTEGTQDNLGYRADIDVVKCENKVAEEIADFIPVFNGYTVKNGSYLGTDIYGNENNVFNAFSDTYWLWQFTGKDAIYGVTPGMLNAYTAELEANGFVGPGESENDGYGEVYSFGMEKVDDAGNIYGVYLRYFAYLSTLEIIYTNSMNHFFGE